MLAKLKTQFYSLIKDLGYNITDNAEYVENFPWLMLRTNGYSSAKGFNLNVASVILVLDIFSSYPGEKEIIEIVENLEQCVSTIQHTNSDVISAYQKSLKILDDKATGPVKKHGVVVYEFLMGYGEEEVPDIETKN